MSVRIKLLFVFILIGLPSCVFSQTNGGDIGILAIDQDRPITYKSTTRLGEDRNFSWQEASDRSSDCDFDGNGVEDEYDCIQAAIDNALVGDFAGVQPCIDLCGTPISVGGIEVFGNEAYLIEGLEAGVEYEFEFCTGYDATNWVAEVIVVEWAGFPFGLITSVVGCTVTFIPPNTGDVLVVITEETDCCSGWLQVGNGTPTFMCTGNGVPAPECEPCTANTLDAYTLSQTVGSILCDAPNPMCGEGTFSSSCFTAPGETAPWQVLPSESYTLPLIDGNEYQVNTCSGDSGTWPVEIVVEDANGDVIATSLTSAPDCEVTFTAIGTGNYTVYVNEQFQCGNNVGVNEDFFNGYFEVVLVDAPGCGSVCNDGICEGPIFGETYCNCILDCPCEVAGATAYFLDEDVSGFISSDDPVIFCSEEIGGPLNPSPAEVYVGFEVVLPSGDCVNHYDITNSEGLIYKNSPIEPLIGTQVLEGITYWLGMTQADIDASGGQTTLAFQVNAGPCNVEIEINWADFGNVSTLAEDSCPATSCDSGIDAGTITGPSLVCYGDDIIINGPSSPTYSSNATNPGIAYGIFNSPGPTAGFETNVMGDPNYTGNNLGVSSSGNFTIIQTLAAGDYWVAPITLYDQVTEEIGACHHVGIGFSITLGEKLDITNLSTSGCAVSAELSGGDPSINGTDFSWEILNSSGGSLSPAVTGNGVPNGGTANAGISNNGNFILVIMDVNGCDEELPFTVNDCAGAECPTVPSPLDAMADLCEGDNLTTIDPVVDLGLVINDPDNQTDSVDWFTDTGVSTPVVAADYAYTGVGCNTETKTFYIGIKCALGGTIYGGEVDVVIYPDFNALTLIEGNTECSVPSLNSVCPNLIITPISVPAIVGPGDSGEATWSVTYDGGPGGSSCFDETYGINYTCGGCPVGNVDMGISAATVCDGDAINLSVSMIPASAVLGTDYNLQWFANGSAISGANSISFSSSAIANNICGTNIINYTLEVACISDGTISIVDFGEVEVYPSYDASALITNSTECLVPSVFSICPDLIITPVNVPTVVNPGDLGTAEWNITYNGGPSCFSESYFLNYNCPNATCPSIELSNATEDVCNSDAPNFAIAENDINYSDPSNVVTGIEWYLDASLSSPINKNTYTVSYSGDGCQTAELVLYAGVECSLSATPIYGGTFTLTIYPDYNSSFLIPSSAECTVPSLTSSCANYDITPINVPSSVVPGDSGVANWLVSYAGSPNCFTENYNLNYNCPNAACPTIDTISPSVELCSGDSQLLQATVNDPDGTLLGVEWTLAGSTNVLSTSNNFSTSYTVSGCVAEEVTYEFTIYCLDDSSISNTVTLTYYPVPTATISENLCSITAVPDCPTYVINGGAPGQSATSTTSINGDNSSVSFVVNNLAAPVSLSCFENIEIGNYNCIVQQCPVITFFPSNIDACSGEEVELLATISDPDFALNGVEWIDLSDGSAIGNANNVTVSLDVNGCSNITKTYLLNVYCEDATFTSETVTVTYYPLPDANISLSNNDCTITAIPICPNFSINAASPGETVVENTNIDGNQAAVTFNVQNPSAPSSLGCDFNIISNNFDCDLPSCPSITSISNNTTSCSASTVTLTANYDDPEGQLVSVKWIDASGAVLSNSLSANVSKIVTDCDGLGVNYSFVIECLDGSEISESVMVTYYPIPIADITLSPNGCSLTATTNCDNFTIDGEPSPVTATTNTNGSTNAVSFLIENTDPNAPVACNGSIVNGAFNCVLSSVNCPYIDASSISATNLICDGDNIDLSISVTDTDNIGYTLEWFKVVNGNPSSIGSGNSLSTTHNLSSCDYEQISFYVELTALDATNCPNISQSSIVEVDVLPELILNTVGDCDNGFSFSANTGCDLGGYNVNVSPASLGPQSSDGSVNVSLSYIGGGACTAVTETYTYNCADLNCPTIVNATPDLVSCSGESLNLSATINDPDGLADGVEWTDLSGNILSTDNTVTVSETITSCTEEQFIYIFKVYCVDGSFKSKTVTITYYPIPDATITQGICEVTATPVCPNYAINGEAAGQAVTISTTDDGSNIPVSFDVVNTSLTQSVNCASNTINTTYNCSDASCPTITGINGPSDACSGEPITLSAQVSDPNNLLQEGQWVTSDGGSFSGLNLNPNVAVNGCTPKTVTYIFIALCLDGTTVNESKTITYYPNPSTSISYDNNGCTIIATPDCPDFSVNGNTAGLAVTTDFTGASSITYNTVNNGASAAGVDCGTDSETLFFNCSSNCIDPEFDITTSCINEDSFIVEVSLSGGSAASYTVSDGANSLNAAAINFFTVTFGPYANNTVVSFTASNNEDASCVIVSSNTVTDDCYDSSLCVSPVVDFTVNCTQGGEYEITASISTLGSDDNYFFSDFSNTIILNAANNYTATLGDYLTADDDFFAVWNEDAPDDCIVYNDPEPNCGEYTGLQFEMQRFCAESYVEGDVQIAYMDTFKTLIKNGSPPYTITSTPSIYSGIINTDTFTFTYNMDNFFVDFTIFDGSGESVTRELFFDDCTTVDIELIEFNGEARAKDNFIYWTTASESDNHYFKLYRSIDGINFEVITTVDAAGNSTQNTYYEYLDQSVHNRGYYYQIGAIDLNGEEEKSSVILVERKAISLNNIEIIPNPVVNDLKVQFNTTTVFPIQINIYDIWGRIVFSQEMKPDLGFNEMKINSMNWSSGTYFLQLSDEQGQQIQRFVK